MIGTDRHARSADGVNTYLSDDHDRIDALLADAVRLVSAGDFDAARPIFASFRAGLERHIRLEDEVLFPLFDRVTGHRGGPTEVMRREHRLIEAALRGMVSALDARDVAGFTGQREELLAVLAPHNDKEEAVIYPMTDQALDDTERARVVASLRAFR